MSDIIKRGSFSEWVWQNKYRHGDEDLDGTFRRVADAVSQAEDGRQNQVVFADEAFEAMRSFEFLPAGRILAGAGTGRDVTLVNCFVSRSIGDSMTGIMDALKEAAMTMRAGGGIGMDFSTLRQRGALVKGLGAQSSGPVSFMDLWNAMCGTIMSAGARRGAMMGVLRVDHPDIEEFVSAKKAGGRLTNFNLSVGVTEEFMNAVLAGDTFRLRFGGQTVRSVEARRLWEDIVLSTHESSEPGVIFIDRVNGLNRLNDVETISASNPCGEQMLPPNGACVLGSINLARLVIDPFRPGRRLNEKRLRELVRIGVRFLDDVIDVTGYPLQAQRDESIAKRRIGLGITGLADALIMLRVRYGSPEAVTWTRHVMSIIDHTAMEESILLSSMKGAYPAWQKGHGPKRRNSHLLSIAPTGTISAFAGNVSSGIEPVFAFVGERNVLMPDGSRGRLPVDDFAFHLYDETVSQLATRPPESAEWITADEVPWREHIDMAAAAQKHVDSAVSKTINVPADISIDDFREVYAYAYEAGMKGCTTYRPSEARGAVLLKKEEGKPIVSATNSNVVAISAPVQRPAELDGTTYKVKPAGSEHALYITITDIEDGDRRRPFEIFLNSKQVDGYAWTLALSRMISAVFRKGGDIAFVADELKQVFDPRGGHWQDGRYVPSLCASIGEVIERHMRYGAVEAVAKAAVGDGISWSANAVPGRQCPKCQRPTLAKREGCDVCSSCDYTKC